MLPPAALKSNGPAGFILGTAGTVTNPGGQVLRLPVTAESDVMAARDAVATEAAKDPNGGFSCRL